MGQRETPPAPALKPVTVNTKDTALLMLDFLHSNCNPEHGKRCIASLPIVKKLLDGARAKHMLVVYSAYGKNTEKNISADVAPNGPEPFVVAFLDKFIGTDLDIFLKLRESRPSSSWAVRQTERRSERPVAQHSGASLLSFQSTESRRTTSMLSNRRCGTSVNAPVISSKITLTKVDIVKF